MSKKLYECLSHQNGLQEIRSGKKTILVYREGEEHKIASIFVRGGCCRSGHFTFAFERKSSMLATWDSASGTTIRCEKIQDVYELIQTIMPGQFNSLRQAKGFFFLYC